MAEWKPRFNPGQIRKWADKYDYNDDLSVIEIGKRAGKAGGFLFDDFIEVCAWKTPRSKPRCRQNTPQEVSEITRIALSTSIERLRIEVLQCLHGVGYPTASVLLHLAHPEPYPILDFRALWSLGFDDAPAYTFDFWKGYVQTCRQLAQNHGVDIRTLDKALWQYSKENQGTSR